MTHYDFAFEIAFSSCTEFSSPLSKSIGGTPQLVKTLFDLFGLYSYMREYG